MYLYKYIHIYIDHLSDEFLIDWNQWNVIFKLDNPRKCRIVRVTISTSICRLWLILVKESQGFSLSLDHTYIANHLNVRRTLTTGQIDRTFVTQSSKAIDFNLLCSSTRTMINDAKETLILLFVHTNMHICAKYLSSVINTQGYRQLSQKERWN